MKKVIKKCDCWACTLSETNYGYQPCIYLRPGVAPPKKAAPLEKEVERRFHRKLLAIGAFTWKFASINTKGVSDRIVIYHGRVIFVELKRDKGIMSPLQISFREKVLSKGGEFCCAYGYAGTDKFIEMLQADDPWWMKYYNAMSFVIKKFKGDIK